MVYDEKLAERIRFILGDDRKVTEKKMFGGLCFLVDGKMSCGILKGDLVLRLSPEQGEEALKKSHVRPMDFTGRPMRGFVYVSPAGHKAAKDLKYWVQLSYTYVDSLEKKKKPKKSPKRK